MRRLLDAAARQDAVVTTLDLDRAGARRGQVRTLVRCGTWVPLLRGTFLVMPDRTGNRLLRSWARAATLTVPDAVAGFGTAVALHGLDVPAEPVPVQVLVPPPLRRRGRDHLEVHHDLLTPGDVVDLRGLPTTTVARTLVDEVPRRPRGDALALLDAALASGQVTQDDLARARALTAGRRGCRAVEDLWLLADGRAESPSRAEPASTASTAVSRRTTCTCRCAATPGASSPVPTWSSGGDGG
ncbi:hypothetical protein [Pseudokineococcus sp. 1T1Z-3]|uniref:hypothetical protein n=1 Tax=Pseudokineococcus sp. 1T1Z-3 TaxID=3132745 RepID=UPI0030B28ECF